MTPRRLLGVVAALTVAGAVVMVLSGSVAVTAVGIVLCGCAAVVLVCIAFLMVGQAEERDRAREDERRGG